MLKHYLPIDIDERLAPDEEPERHECAGRKDDEQVRKQRMTDGDADAEDCELRRHAQVREEAEWPRSW